MLTLDDDGTLTLTVSLPGARRIEVVGTFEGWHEQHLPMEQIDEGVWRLRLVPPPGEHLFRYLVDDQYWLLDGSAHGSRLSVRGYEMSRVWVPPTPGSDAIAA